MCRDEVGSSRRELRRSARKELAGRRSSGEQPPPRSAERIGCLHHKRVSPIALAPCRPRDLLRRAHEGPLWIERTPNNVSDGMPLRFRGLSSAASANLRRLYLRVLSAPGQVGLADRFSFFFFF